MAFVETSDSVTRVNDSTRVKIFGDSDSTRVTLRKMVTRLQSRFRDEHGSGLDRTGSGLKPILAGSGLQFFSKVADQDWIGLGKFFLF